tara:strand:+ start:1061 stop:1255 length:195 start_codon:yes stop_codon:yes gene_type:complete
MSNSTITKKQAIAQIIESLLEAGDLEELVHDVMTGETTPVHLWSVDQMVDHLEYATGEEVSIKG